MKKLYLIFPLLLVFFGCFLGIYGCGHNHVYTDTVIASTCVEKGYTLHQCECGNYYKDAYTNALGHDFVNYISDNNATCDCDGTKTAQCSRVTCDEINTVVDSGSKLIKVELYIDNQYSDTIYTCENKNYEIVLPDNPDDITTNRNIEKYFYGWFLDEYCETLVTDGEKFSTDSKIYAKWIRTDSSIFSYTVSNGEATITGRKNKTSTLMVVPTFINSFSVKNIYASAFLEDTILKKLIICEGVENINSHAFKNCSSLTEIIMPESIKTIGTTAFSGCYSIEELTIPKNVRTIASGAFASCKSLRKIYFNAINCNAANTMYTGGGNFGDSAQFYTSIFISIPDNQIECVVGELVEYIHPLLFRGSYSYPCAKFKKFIFEEPYGWYEYEISYINGMITDKEKVDNMNIEFRQGASYGKK